MKLAFFFFTQKCLLVTSTTVWCQYFDFVIIAFVTLELRSTQRKKQSAYKYYYETSFYFTDPLQTDQTSCIADPGN